MGRGGRVVDNVQPIHRDDDWRAAEAGDCRAKVASLDFLLDALHDMQEEFPNDDALRSAARALAACARSKQADLSERLLVLLAGMAEADAERRSRG
jgi:hypothetical protein